VGVLIQLAIRTKIEEAAGGVVRARSEGLGVGEELDGVDVGLVAHKRLDALAGPDIPDLCRGITGTGHKDLLLWRDGKATQQKKRKKLEKEKKKKKEKNSRCRKKGFTSSHHQCGQRTRESSCQPQCPRGDRTYLRSW